LPQIITSANVLSGIVSLEIFEYISNRKYITSKNFSHFENKIALKNNFLLKT